jgi:hypothetical protein
MHRLSLGLLDFDDAAAAPADQANCYRGHRSGIRHLLDLHAVTVGWTRRSWLQSEMSLAHVSVAKAVALVGNIAALAFFALDPTVQVALIAGAALVITNIPALVIAIMNRKTTKDMSVNVDGNLKRLLDEKVAQAAEMADQSGKLSRAEGRREGMEAGRQDERDYRPKS